MVPTDQIQVKEFWDDYQGIFDAAVTEIPLGQLIADVYRFFNKHLDSTLNDNSSNSMFRYIRVCAMINLAQQLEHYDSRYGTSYMIQERINHNTQSDAG